MRMRPTALIAVAVTVVTVGASAATAGPILYALGNINEGAARNRSFLYTVDTTTGAATLVGDTGANLRGLAYNPLTGKAYGSRAELDVTGGFYEINLVTGAAVLIGGTQNFSKMEFDGSGNLFGYGPRRADPNNAYDFFSIDVNTGVGTLLNSSALNMNDYALFDIAYSSADSSMYYFQRWFNGSGGEGLSTVNTANGSVTSVVTGTFEGIRADIAVDDNGNFYAIDVLASITTLYRLNTATSQTTAIGSNRVSLNSMAFADDVVPVPEPTSVILLGTGLAAAAARARRRRKNHLPTE